MNEYDEHMNTDLLLGHWWLPVVGVGGKGLGGVALREEQL